MASISTVSPAVLSLPGTEGGRECRICLQGEEVCSMVQPCSCVGSVQWVHVGCFTEWVNRQA